MRKITSSLLVALLVPCSLSAATFDENFTSDPTTPGGHWVKRNADGDNGNNYGFSNTNFTGGTSPAGEAGGVFTRSDFVGSYTDETLGLPGTLFDLDDTLYSAGEMYVNDPDNDADLSLHIGYQDPSTWSANPFIASIGLRNALGFTLAEPSSPPDFRGLARVYLSDGTAVTGNIISLPQNTALRWVMNYSPSAGSFSNGLLSIEFFNGVTSLGISSLSLTAAHRLTGASLDAFGIVNTATSSPNSGVELTFYVDGLTYTETAIPEPAMGMLFGGMALFALSRRTH